MRRSFLAALLAATALGLLPAAAAAQGRASGIFDLAQLPKGKNVTIPRPATTHVPLNARVQLKATDMPQTLSFRPVNVAGGALAAIRLAIFDRQADRVKYVDLKPGTPFLYTFQALDAITVIPETKAAVAIQSLKLQVESNKPLEIAH